jgi:hypothetical protein
MELLCTNCSFDIDAKTANVQTNLVQCPNCYLIHQLNDLIQYQKSLDDLTDKELKKYRTEYEEKEAQDNAIFNDTNFDLLPFESKTFSQPPKGSKIEIFETSAALEIEVPPQKFSGLDIFPLGFTIFWLGFITIWTSFAIWGGAGFMVLFSIPFWLAGFSMAAGLIGSLMQRQTIEIDRYLLKVTKKSLFRTHVYEFDIDDIDDIEMKAANLKNSFKKIRPTKKPQGNHKNNHPNLPTISIGIKNHIVFEYVTEAEQYWGLKTLKAAIAKFSERKV